MKKIFLGLSVVTFLALSTSMITFTKANMLDDIVNVTATNSNRKTVVRKLATFENIDASSAVSIKLVEGNNNGEVTITADEDVLNYIKTEVKNNTLEIGVKWDKKIKIKNNGKIEVSIPVKKLRSLKLSGTSTLEAGYTINVENFKADLSGATKASLNLMSNTINVDLSGASKLELSGNVQNLNLDLSGASKFSGSALKASAVKFDLSGASSSKVWVVNQLSGSASGASSLAYKNVTGLSKDVSTSGASSVKAY